MISMNFHKPSLPLPSNPACHLVGFLPAHFPPDRAPVVVMGMTPTTGGCGSIGATGTLYIQGAFGQELTEKQF